jgi:hypothetical protein
VWIQARECFVDVRTGLVETRAFGGTASWHPPRMTWRHEIDVPPTGSESTDDVGTLSVVGQDGVSSDAPLDEFVERGTWLRDGRDEAYEEHWERIGPAGPVVALASGRSRFLAVGGHAAVVTPDGWCRWQDGGTGWAVGARSGNPDVDLPPRLSGAWRPWATS